MATRYNENEAIQQALACIVMQKELGVYDGARVGKIRRECMGAAITYEAGRVTPILV